LPAAVALTAILMGSAAWARGDTADTRNTYGEIGLLEMPSARMAPDGELAATIGILSDNQRYNAAFQILPWLDASFRYSHTGHYLGIPNLIYDRSFGVKVRFFKETENFPEISLGIRDILGTGLYSGEYVVVTKRVGDFDLTAGMGWGRLASNSALHNPFALLLPSFGTRSAFSGSGGTVNLGQFFHGPKAGLFGGIEWLTPIDGLNAIVEYSSDRYTNEGAAGGLKARLPFNFGASYRPYDGIKISAGWMYGSSYGLTVDFWADPSTGTTIQRLGPAIPAPAIRSSSEQAASISRLLAGANGTHVGAWVQNASLSTISSALMAEAAGVHDIDIEGHTVIVNASVTQSADQQCGVYARLVANLGQNIQTLALTDLSANSDRVTTCTISSTAKPNKELAPQKIRTDVASQNLHVEGLSIEASQIWLYFSNTKYYSEAEAAGRIARTLMNDAPPDVEIFHIIAVNNGLPIREFRVARTALERVTLASGTTREVADAVTFLPAPFDNPVFDQEAGFSYPRYHWSIGPGLRESLFDPLRPLQVQILAALNASVDITPNIALQTRLEANIYNTFTFGKTNTSVLPHVRTDRGRYFTTGTNGIQSLFADYHTRLSPTVFVEAKAGYLEDMFAGAGLQALWRPEGERIAIGVDLYQVWQRNFDRLLGVQHYNTVTGHVSVYYESPWYGLNFAVHAGRYLAGDYGATVEVTRRFSTGVEVGAFATFTNVPYSAFGEGSFDKGILLRIPFEWALPFYSRSTYDLDLRSLTRDGGQRLEGDDSLYDATLQDSYSPVADHADEIVAP